MDVVKVGFKTEEEAIKEEYYKPKKFGEGKTVEYEIDGMRKSYCKLTESIELASATRFIMRAISKSRSLKIPKLASAQYK